jgi:hypothetical protein
MKNENAPLRRELVVADGRAQSDAGTAFAQATQIPARHPAEPFWFHPLAVLRSNPIESSIVLDSS